MNYRNVSNFAKGLMTAAIGRGKAPLDSLLVAENVRVHTGSAEPRPGQLWLDEDVTVAQTITSLYQYTREYWDSVNDERGTYTEYMFSGGTRLYGWEGPGDDTVWWINESDPLGSDEVWIGVYNDWAYVADGVNPMHRHDAVHYYEVGIGKPADPVVALGAANVGFPTGYRKYKYRYTGIEHDDLGNIRHYVASPFSDEVLSPHTNNREFDITLAQSADDQVDYIELYTTELGANEAALRGVPFYRLDYNVALLFQDSYNYRGLDNSVVAEFQPFTDDVVDADLTDEATLNLRYLHPEFDDADANEDWTAPPDGLSKIIVYKDRMYGVAKDNPSVLQYSRLGQMEAWPADNWIDIRRDDGDVITAITVRGNSLYIFKNRSIWVLTGDPDAVPILEAKVGGEGVATQTEVGLGCTAPRSVAAYGDDMLIFYSSIYGVYMIAGASITSLSRGLAGVTGLSDYCAGVIYHDEHGEVLYALSPPSGDAWVCHIASKAWVNDTGTNTPCFCIDSSGYVLGPVGGGINRFFNPDVDTDNDVEIIHKLQPNWLNLRNGDMHAVVKRIQFQTEDLVDACTLALENEKGVTFTTSFTGEDRYAGINGLAGRLFSPLLTWGKGNIESMTYYFTRRRAH